MTTLFFQNNEKYILIFFLIKCLHLKTPVINLYLLLTFPPDYKILQHVREKTQIKTYENVITDSEH